MNALPSGSEENIRDLIRSPLHVSLLMFVKESGMMWDALPQTVSL